MIIELSSRASIDFFYHSKNFGISWISLKCHTTNARNIFPIGTVFSNFGLFVKLNCARIIDTAWQRRKFNIGKGFRSYDRADVN